MTKVKSAVLAHKRRLLTGAIAGSLLIGGLVTLLVSEGAQADFYTGCGYGYTSGGTFGYGSSYGYGYSGNVFQYGSGYQVCPQSSSVGATSTAGDSVPAPPPSDLPATVFGSPVSTSASSTTSSSVTLSTGTTTATVTVPAGALPAGTTVSVYPIPSEAPVLQGALPAGEGYVLSLAVTWETPSGTSPTANSSITLTITNPGIKAGDPIYIYTAVGIEQVGTATVDGSATVTFTLDPVFVVASPAVTSQTTTPPAGLHASLVSGAAAPGKTVSITVKGTGFYGQPKITSSLAGTKAIVSKDTGTSLTVKITTPASAKAGSKLLTIKLANGKTVKIAYKVS